MFVMRLHINLSSCLLEASVTANASYPEFVKLCKLFSVQCSVGIIISCLWSLVSCSKLHIHPGCFGTRVCQRVDMVV